MPNIGEVRYGDAPWHLEPLVIDSLAGTIRINLATATVATGETPIVINGGAGEVRIQVPPELPVSIMVEVSEAKCACWSSVLRGCLCILSL